MKKKFFAVTVFVILCIVTRVCISSDKFALVFSGEEYGSLIPCGCFEGQLGGVTRRDTLLKKYRSQGIEPVAISTGDLINGLGRQEEIKMEFLYRALGEMDYVLHNLGERDLEIGPQVLSFLSQSDGVTFLSSNVKFTTPFPIRIKNVVLKKISVNSGSINVAFLGIVSKSLINAHILDYVRVSDPMKRLNPLVHKLQKKSDILVLISHAPIEESIEIARSFPEIDLILTGHGIDEPHESVEYVKNTPVVSHGKKGKYVVVADYTVNNNNKVRRTSIDVVPLDEKYNDSERMERLLKDYQQVLKDEDLLSSVSQIPLPSGWSYVGSYLCGTCHKKIYEHWNETLHSKSYSTLVRAGQEYDPECIECHTTGYGYVSGFLNYKKDKHLSNVGCESCHGAGSNHVKDVEEKYDSMAKEECGRCHESEHSPEFQYNEYWEKIRHPKESLDKVLKQSLR